MSDLLKLEPGGRGKLYKDIGDDEVDANVETFTWEWIKKATKIKKKANFKAHLESGHFGAWEQIGSNRFRLTEGHRAICRYNNGRHKHRKTIVVSKEQYKDMMEGRPIRDMVIMVRGRPHLKSVSIKNYNHRDFISVKRYTNDQARGLALERVENDIDAKTVSWHNLPRNDEEFQGRYQARVKMFEDLLLAEMVLMAKDTASPEDIRAAADLPASILSLIDYKLSATHAEYYISRFLAAQETIPDITKNPFMAFRMHQVILEELQIEHYRDLQRLYGDEIDKKVQDGLSASLSRLSRLTPGKLMKAKTPGGGNTMPAPLGAAAGADIDNDPFGEE